MDTFSDNDVFDMVEYLAWCERANRFRGEFEEKFVPSLVDMGWDRLKAKIICDEVWERVKSDGIVRTFQAYIADEEVCKALIHAMNI